MRIQELHLQNFRGFKDLKITFPNSNVAVFIGVNGVGKSSILDAIAILLSLAVSKFLGSNSKRQTFSLTEDDINVEASKASINMVASFQEEIFDFHAERDRTKKGVLDKKEILAKYLHGKLQKNSDFNLPILVYYQTNRYISQDTFSSGDKTVKAYEFPQFHALQNAFVKNFSSFDDFVNWFVDEEDLENQIISRSDRDYINENLQAIRETVKVFFSSLHASYFSDLRVVRTRTNTTFSYASTITSSLEVNKKGQALKINRLSEGEKSLFIIVCDIARRLTVANPSLENSREGQGIVLIDEIDAHLHPQWQREVIPALQTTFPNCQFITNTHSPQVLSNVHRSNILILENWKIVEETPYSYGRDTNSILYELMGVEERPRAIRDRLDECFHLIDNGETESAKARLLELRKQLGENDPDIIRALTMIDFLTD